LIPGSENKQVAAFVKGTPIKPNVPNTSISKQPFIQPAVAGKDGAPIDNSANFARAQQPNMSSNPGYQPPSANTQNTAADSVQFNNLGANVSQGVNFNMDAQ
jgi:hypothetical protein